MIAEDKVSIPEPLSSGTRLRKAREGLGLSTDDVAGELRLSVSQIKALEQDDYTELPGATYVRGYLRSYARLVNIDEDSVLPPLQPEPVLRTMHAIARPVQRQARSSDRWVRFMSYGLGILLIGLVTVWWRSQSGFDFEKDFLAELPDLVAEKMDGNRTSGNAPLQEEKPVQIITTPSETGFSQPEPRASKPTAASTADTELRTTPSVTDAQDGRPERENATPQAVTATTSRQSPSVPAMNVGKIALKFSQASWAEIRDANNKRLLHRSFHAGREVEVEGTPPFSIFLGNAGGVRMEYNGRQFDITPYQTGLYARFVIDDAGGF